MNSRRKATRRDFPALCLLFGAIFTVAAIALPFGAKLDLTKRSELYPVSGTVERVERTFAGKAGAKLHIFINDGNRTHHLTQDDLSYDVPALRSLAPGDKVVALVRRDFLGRDLEWFWEVQRGGGTMLSYDETQTFLEREAERFRIVARFAGAFSIALLVIAVLLRVRFGAWRDHSFSSAVN